jgi:hypothetical protein
MDNPLNWVPNRFYINLFKYFSHGIDESVFYTVSETYFELYQPILGL